ncbi:MAG: protein kinase [bacterium]|nr:protein kinase [bacterium]
MSGQTPEKLGRYEILDELGKGAMGVVYLGRDPLIGRQVALKTFHLGYSAGDQELEQFRTRFLREAQSAGILNHPNIVAIHDVAVDPDGDFFIAMEYVQGTDLKLLMQRQGRFDPRFTIDIVAQIAEGIGYAHSKGVVHRDIKPANIILTADKQAKITDFGIARVETSNLTMEGQLLGTPNYMAPEQIQGKEVDHRADIFSLGVMLYELVTGQKPFAADNLTAVTHRIVFEPFMPPDQIVQGLPPGITAVLDRALAKDPAARYDRGVEMANDLRAILDPASAPPPAARTGSFLEAGPPAAQPMTTADGTVVATPQGTVAPPVATQPADPHMTPQPLAQPPAAPQQVLPPVVFPQEAAGPDTPDVPPAPGRGFLSRPPVVRMALVAVSVLAVSLVAAGAARMAVKDEEVLPQGQDPKLQRQLRLLPHLKEGRALLDAGDPSAALDAFEAALALAPENRNLRRLRDQAQRKVLQVDGIDLEEEYVTERIEAAREALRQRDYPVTIRLAEEVLKVDPDHADGKELLASAREGQRRKEQVRARLSSAPPSTTAAPPPPATSTTPTAQATLAVDFFSEVSEGRLTIFNGQEKIFQQPFKFVSGKSGFMRRARKTSGSLKGNLTLPSGDLDLRIYVWRKGAQTKTAEVKGNLPAGSLRTLGIRVSAEGRVSVQLE